ncbi:MAG: carboxymuconolactone decarboxylase family protein [Rhodospirillaceae bacterium]|nr:MAG: carboxymuconolactone decarboxylase family protein [Rhodospirillaceae bacterium]
MSKISQLPIEKWDPELRALTQADSASALEKKGMGVTAHAPHMAKAMGAFMAKAMKDHKLSRRLIELVRLRVAFHNQCRTCMAVRYQSAVDDGLTEDMVCSLEKPQESPDLTEREKAALAYADLFATNHLAIDDEMFDNLHRYYTEAEMVELMLFVSFFVGFGRFGAVINAVEELPKGFQDKSKKAAPWQIRESVVVRG